MRYPIFIYCPTTGDRVFAEKTHKSIAVVQWANNCRHAHGGAHFVLPTAWSGAWYRDDACRVVADFVAIHGGIAWDENGDVNVVIPRSASRGFYSLLTIFPHFKREEFLKQALRQGLVGLSEPDEEADPYWRPIRIEENYVAWSKGGRENDATVKEMTVTASKIFLRYEEEGDEQVPVYVTGADVEVLRENGERKTISAPWSCTYMNHGEEEEVEAAEVAEAI